jgi:hypothetical protein
VGGLCGECGGVCRESDERPMPAEDRRGSAVVRDFHTIVLRLGKIPPYARDARVRVSKFPADGRDILGVSLRCGRCLARFVYWMNCSHR